MGLALIPALIVLLWPARWTLSRGAPGSPPVLLLPLALGALRAVPSQHRFGDATVFLDAQAGDAWNRDLSVVGPLSGTLAGRFAGVARLARDRPSTFRGARARPTGYEQPRRLGALERRALRARSSLRSLDVGRLAAA